MTATLDARPDPVFLRAWRFAQKPWEEKAKSLCCRWARAFPDIPLPLRLPFGGWWLVRNDYCSFAIASGSFEKEETHFVEHFLRGGMTVLDIGAHHGYYTLLASKRVGRHGRVIAFEPSPRERKFLERHMSLNRCENVNIEALALGSASGEADLFVVDGTETGCNSLRPPSVTQSVRGFRVPLEQLDVYLEHKGVEKVDFIKLDAEGGELEILKGATKLLGRVPRPLILAEVQDVRTQPWGYEAREIIRFLSQRDFHWYRMQADGGLSALPLEESAYDGNFVAVPAERGGDVKGMTEAASVMMRKPSEVVRA
jgi:FkbM family methyltransferase